MLRKLAEDYPSMRYGWPDLMIVDDAGVRFAEIKAEGDQLKRSQLLRLRQMRAAGLRADVLRVRWVLDPAQEYVVVDVETTGGHGEQHRITEIAAVKLRDGVIVDRYQSLINPQRAIPPGITRLTGISDAMVADAPVFAGIAGAFDEFIGEAIFVAHNVNFDYGFVSREYARLGQRFRRPKLCTCASMRKLYPGHDSYSLASLCERYQIPLKSHHRAMCDAEAAAELLLLVNERRAAALQDG
jgi:DNA polymerase-3 subunit epsilon